MLEYEALKSGRGAALRLGAEVDADRVVRRSVGGAAVENRVGVPVMR